eukprot:COSAG04_NODE_2691_length_3725_cov_211.624655_2_plen_57_part_00
MHFKDDDSDPKDYVISSVDNKFALVDHPKFDQCAVGQGSIASAWYVSEEEQAGQRL